MSAPRSIDERAELAAADGEAAEEGSRLSLPISVGVGRAADPGAAQAGEAPAAALPKLDVRGLSVAYGSFVAVRDLTIQMPANHITAIIGPSGSGKSTFLRAINRMHDTVPSAVVTGDILLDGVGVYSREMDPVLVRRKIGMVFQRPNPFAKSIFDNVAYGLRYGTHQRMSRSEISDRVEQALKRAALWNEVSDRLDRSAMGLSGGQQQRLCIARAIAVEPEVILMDEPASALDPIATLRIEDLMTELVEDYTIVIVTHNMQQAARVSDITCFMTMGEDRAGILVEAGPTRQVFTSPRDRRTEDYITGRMG